MSFVTFPSPNPYPSDDTGPDFDAATTIQATDYGQHIIDIYTKRLEAYQRLLPTTWDAYWQLLHRMKPVMASTPVPREDVNF